MAAQDVRPSPIAGQWYAGDRTDLSREVDRFLDAAILPELKGELVGVIAPHAGHTYSGAVAGHAFAALRGRKIDLVAVLAPMHGLHPASLLTTAHSAYETPLGFVEVDGAALEALNARLQRKMDIGITTVRRDREHSLEVELPFLQRALAPGWKLLPVMVRTVESRVVECLGHALAEVVRDRSFVLVGSTDLSHFYRQEMALAFDQAMLRSIEELAPERMFQLERAGKGFACGLGAAAAVLWAALSLGANNAVILRHATSGDVTGDYMSVVGYGAIAIQRVRSVGPG